MAETGFDEAEVDEGDLLEYDCSEHGDGTEDADGGEDSGPEVVAHDCGEAKSNSAIRECRPDLPGGQDCNVRTRDCAGWD